MAAMEEAARVRGRGPAQLVFAATLRFTDELGLEEGCLHAEVSPVDGEVLDGLAHRTREAHLAGEFLEALASGRVFWRLTGVCAAAGEEEAEPCVDDGDRPIGTSDDRVGGSPWDHGLTLYWRTEDHHGCLPTTLR